MGTKREDLGVGRDAALQPIAELHPSHDAERQQNRAACLPTLFPWISQRKKKNQAI